MGKQWGRQMKRGLGMVMASLLVFGLAACSSDNQNESANGASNQQANGKEAVEIEFFQQKREAVETFDQLISAFNTDNKEVNMKQNNVPDSSKVLITRMASNDMPPVFTDWPLKAEFKARVSSGMVMELTGDPMLDNVKPEILEMLKMDGKVYAMPVALNTVGVFYNVDMFEEHGLAIPQTYDELIQIAQSLQDKGITPFVFPDKDAWTIGFEAQAQYGLTLPDNGDVIVKAISGEQHLNELAELERVAEKMLEMRTYSTGDSLGTSYDDATREFATGNAAMFFQGIWNIPSIQKANPSLQFAMFPLPAEQADQTKVMINIDSAIAIAASAEDPDAAKQFVSYMSEPEHAQIYSSLDKSPSAIKDVQTDVKEYELLSKKMDAGESYIFPNTKWLPGMDDQHRKAVQNLIASEDPQMFMDEMDSIFFDKQE
ncbi:ABC transporter substrate-binding protein [Marinicrinis sediminis]|uniref:ABC transporter substrate-binding protein n=1 Tax=Marinicrinis sediminis TaxID=1652465 RepID=A0ABW5RC05_9BACL